MKMKKVSAVSLGCDKNRVDTERMLGMLGAAGYVAGAEPEDADIIIVNTCAFIADAVDESHEIIEEMVALKKSGSCEKLIVAGCLPERDSKDLMIRFPEVDLLVGAREIGTILKKLRESEGVILENAAADEQDSTAPRLITTMPWRAYLKISEGCSNSCSYCMIPAIRGPYRSFAPDILVAEARQLADMGVKELTVVAQDSTRYGSDVKNFGCNLSGLLEKLASIDGIKWIRLMYAYPELVDKQLAATIASLGSVCKYIDMPVQHISGEILTAMKRRGGPDAIRGAIDLLRDASPDICIRTTLMVGFPGETDAHFRELVKFVEETRFDRMGVFPYSMEKGTAAATMPGQLIYKTKNERLHELMTLQQEISLEKNETLVGQKMTVLIEDVDEEDGEKFSVGRTYRDAPDIDGMFFLDRVVEPGTFVEATVIAAGEYDLRGE